MLSAPSWLFLDGQTASVSQREWQFCLWCYQSSLHLSLCQGLLVVPATRAYYAAHLFKKQTIKQTNKTAKELFLYGVVHEPPLQDAHDAHPPQWRWNRAQQSSAGHRWNVPWLMERQKGGNSSTWGIFPFPPTATSFSLSGKHKQTNPICIFIARGRWLLD